MEKPEKQHERRTATIPLWSAIVIILSLIISGSSMAVAANAEMGAKDHASLATKAEVTDYNSLVLQRLASLEAKMDLILSGRIK